MTGFEPATLTLAMSFGLGFSPALIQFVAAHSPFLVAHDYPQVTKIVNGVWYFRGADVRESRTT
jgi:hypothetical protein